MVEIKIQKIHEDAIIPSYAHTADSGADLFSIKNYTLQPGERIIVDTGLKMQIPEGYEGQIRSKSGLALRYGIKVLNSPATIDAHYRGGIGVILINLGKEPYEVRKGQKIAQIVFQEVKQADFRLSDSLEDTVRGEGGFGSTGLS